jgi:Zn-dependent peptidase ImmA (M78 family)
MNPLTKAAKVLRAHPQHGPYVDVGAIAETVGIQVIRRTFDPNTTGTILMDTVGNVVLAVNDAHHPNRQRFTIAHLLGHYVMHKGGARMFVDRRDWRAGAGCDRREVEANQFAAALLMPEPMLRAVLGERILDVFAAEEELALRAAELRVGVHMLAQRLRSLDLLYDAAEVPHML